MSFRLVMAAIALYASACSTGSPGHGGTVDQASVSNGGEVEPSKADRGDMTDTEWANQFFVTQIYDERFNPDGIEVDAESNNCGPASLSMILQQRGIAPTGLSAEASIDHARALMYPGYPDIAESSLVDGATLYSDGDVILVDDDTHPVFFEQVDDAPSIVQGIETVGGDPDFAHAWNDLEALLGRTGAAIAHGHITEDWRSAFSEDYGDSTLGPVSHFIAIFPASTAGLFLVCDPMHRGGAVLMTKGQLGKFFRSPVNAFETTIRVVSWDDTALSPVQSGPDPQTP